MKTAMDEVDEILHCRPAEIKLADIAFPSIRKAIQLFTKQSTPPRKKAPK
jgi:hypothetical protein